MNRFLHRLALSAIVFSGLILWGCASTPPTRFYTLSPLPGSEKPGGSGSERCVSIGIGPVKIPGYLDQTGIVTHLSQNEYRVGEFSRWSEPLEENISRILAANLTSLLCTEIVSTFPWKGSVPMDYRVFVEIVRMDGSLGESAVFDASWTIFDNAEKRKLLLAKQTHYKETPSGKGHEAYVAAQSRNLGALSREIAEAIQKLPR